MGNKKVRFKSGQEECWKLVCALSSTERKRELVSELKSLEPPNPIISSHKRECRKGTLLVHSILQVRTIVSWGQNWK